MQKSLGTIDEVHDSILEETMPKNKMIQNLLGNLNLKPKLKINPAVVLGKKAYMKELLKPPVSNADDDFSMAKYSNGSWEVQSKIIQKQNEKIRNHQANRLQSKSCQPLEDPKNFEVKNIKKDFFHS